MAQFYIAEGSHLETDANGQVVLGMKMPPNASQSFSFTTTTQSAAFTAGTRFVRIWSDTDCYVAWGSNPTAVSGASMPISAKAAEYFAVQQGHKIAAVT